MNNDSQFTVLRTYLKIVSIGLAMLLAGCIRQPLTPPTAISSQPPSRFELEGRIALHNAKDNLQANLNWQQNGESSDVRITAPFGQGTLILNIRPEQSMAQLNQQILKSNNPDQLFFELTQLSWPIRGAHRWLTGHPKNEDSAQISYYPAGQIRSIEEEGWRITYSQWQLYQQQLRPKMITIEREETQIKIAITSWKIRS